MAISLWSSVFSLPTLTLPANWSASRSMVGARARQGPHHTAQKSTRTGFSLLTTSFSQLSVVSSITLALAIIVPSRWASGVSSPHYTRQGGAVTTRGTAPRDSGPVGGYACQGG